MSRLFSGPVTDLTACRCSGQVRDRSGEETGHRMQAFFNKLASDPELVEEGLHTMSRLFSGPVTDLTRASTSGHGPAARFYTGDPEPCHAFIWLSQWQRAEGPDGLEPYGASESS